MTSTKSPAAALAGLVAAVASLATGALAAAGAQAVPNAADDAGVVRAVGVGFTGMFRALDVVVAAVAMLVPVGTRASRAGVASALVAAACAALAVEVARRAAEAVVPVAVARLGRAPAAGDDRASPALIAAVAGAAVLTATLAPAWQRDAAAPGGAVTGALLVASVLALASRMTGPEALPPLGLALGLCASYEPIAFVSALAALAPHAKTVVTRERPVLLKALAAFGLGLLPLGLGLALARRDPGIALAVPLASFADPRPASAAPVAFFKEEIGSLLAITASLGAAAALAVPAGRRMALSLLAVIAVGAASIFGGAGPGGGAGRASVLVAILALHVLAGFTLAAVVLVIARTRVPFAKASATLVVVLELVLPVRSADESVTRRDARSPRAAAWWSEVAWGSAPPAAVVLLPSAPLLARAAASKAIGEMRGDLIVVPAFDLRTRLGDRALAAEPKLAPLYRDVALGSPPEELSFAQLADRRAVLASFDPKWDRALARHLVPVGLFARFEAEPRGVSDRRKALDAFAPSKERLVRVAVAKKDAELAALTASLLRARAIAMAATGDREVLARALDDLRPFGSADDPVASALVRRMVTSKGPIDVRDLTP